MEERVPSVEPTELFTRIRLGTDVTPLLTSEAIAVENHFGMTPLLYAVAYNRSVVIPSLLDQRADINHQDKRGFGVLHIAAHKDLSDLFSVLISKGADPTLQTKAMELAYQVAFPKERKACYAELLGQPYVSRFGDTIEESMKMMAGASC